MELVSWHQLKLEKYNNKNIQPDSQPGDLNNKIEKNEKIRIKTNHQRRNK